MTEPKQTPATEPTLQHQNGQWILTLPINEQTIIQTAQQILKDRFKRMTEPLTDREQIREYLQLVYQPYDRKVFSCLFLDDQHRVIGIEDLFHGTVNTTMVAPREIIRAALKHNATSIILIHNSPSGSDMPSEDDVKATVTLQQICRLADLKLLDHYLVSAEVIASFVELELMESSNE